MSLEVLAAQLAARGLNAAQISANIAAIRNHVAGATTLAIPGKSL